MIDSVIYFLAMLSFCLYDAAHLWYLKKFGFDKEILIQFILLTILIIGGALTYGTR